LQFFELLFAGGALGIESFQGAESVGRKLALGIRKSG
jgi:hypothetical protein